MPQIFISYRREDSAGYAGHLSADLQKKFGDDAIFMDVDGAIEPGLDFVDVIERAVGSCDALVVMIGRDWQSLLDDRTTLEDSDDFVRIETATALRRNIRVVPVLVGDASMPNAEQLPADLKPLARRQAIELSDTRWDFDVDQLVRALKKALGNDGPDLKRSRWPAVAIIAILLAVLAFAVSGIWRSEMRETSDVAGTSNGQPNPTEPIESPATTRSVPNVVGNSLRDAKTALTNAGLTHTETEEPSDRPAGTVLSQSPLADATVEKGSSVALAIAVAPVTMTTGVPNVVGNSFTDATAALSNAGLTYTKREEPSDRPAGTVLSQNPNAEATVEEGSSVELVIAIVPVAMTVRVPNVLGKSLREATTALTNAGLTLTRRDKLSRRPAGTVLGQNPKSDTTVENGTSIALQIAVAGATMPNLVGIEFQDAQGALKNLGLDVAKKTTLTLGRRGPGTIYNQDPSSGSSVSARTQVHLYVDIALPAGHNHTGQLYLGDKEVFNLDAPENDDVAREEDDVYLIFDSRGSGVLEPINGAMFANITEARRIGDCAYLGFTAARVRTTAGTVICVRTNKRHVGMIRFLNTSDSNPPELEISFKTWE